jgi:AraC-like DNA-binding protein
MHYREIEPPEAMRPLVKLAWRLDIPAGGPAWVKHVATPDGCMEIIRRLSGRSRWRGDQPEFFAAGLITEPADLDLSAPSAFIGVRIWPWTWRLISGQSPAASIDRWLPLDRGAFGLDLADEPEAAIAGLSRLVPTPAMRAIGDAVATARSPADRCRQAGLSPRVLQRWFAHHVGLPPRTWLRLVRFSDAFAGIASAEGGLAGHAAEHGFADQAHMAREFRSLAGESAGRARGRAKGPFLTRK